MDTNTASLLAFVSGIVALPSIVAACKFFTLEVADMQAVVVTRFGKIDRVICSPGLRFFPYRNFPGTTVHKLSLKRDFMECKDIHVNDCRGTTVITDLWLEYHIVDPTKVLFGVADWQQALQGIVASAATGIIGTFEFSSILADGQAVGDRIKSLIESEVARWGIEVDMLFISKLSLIPSVSQQLFDSISARIERAKADIEEDGRMRASLLDANTSAKIASLLAEAKGQYGLAVSRAYQKMSANPEVFAAYRTLYEISQLRPQRTVCFQGFERGQINALEALMAAPVPGLEGAHEQALDG